ncbi:MAG TPA: UvrB/UvrC motif-containing protein [Gemmatimonadales bacterium]|nr:UvrB/UvrC motif-containing protein [Gemmatimonadales bacterium]
MKCENCGERDAVIHLTQIQDSQVTTLHLCEPCAAEKGVDTGATVAKFPLGDFLASLGKVGSAPEVGVDIACEGCGATLADFRATGRLGCARCYDSFEAHLRDLLRRLHGSSVHAGEPYHGAAAPEGRKPRRADRDTDLARLKEQLRRAVEAENFELAAELRDKIRVLE